MSTPVEQVLSSRSRLESERRRVLQVSKGLAATIGSDFFVSVVRHLAAAFHADRAYIGELAGTPSGHIRTLAVFEKRYSAENFEEDLAGTAAGQVIADGSLLCSRDALRIFPEDRKLAAMGAESYVGIRLCDAGGQPIGLIAIVSRQRVADSKVLKSVLETFAPRTAAELERKRTDDVHRENEERYHAFVAMNPDAMWRIEFEQPVPVGLPEDQQLDRMYRFGYLAECNQALASIAARSVEQLVGSRLEAVAPRTEHAAVEELRAVIRSGFRVTCSEATVLDASGCPRQRLRTYFGIVENAELRRLWGTTRDITDLRRAELSAADSERRSREVLEGVHLLAVVFNPQGTITFCNEFFVRFTERSKAELEAATWLDCCVSPGESEIWKDAMLDDRRQTTPNGHFKGLIIPPHGEPRPVLWDTICLRDHNGQVKCLAAIGRDLRYQNTLEMRTREARKLDDIARLAADIAHDIDDLLMVIVRHAKQLIEPSLKADPAPQAADIHSAATMCVELTRQLLAFSHRQHPHLEHLDVNSVIVARQGVVRALLGTNIELILDLGSTSVTVYADPTQIQRTLANLVTNARDAMPQGGRLTIATSNLDVAEEDTAYPDVNAGPYLRLSVIDTGAGLSKEGGSHLFEPLFNTREPGKGSKLGLAAVYRIVTQSGGYIFVRSQLGLGTTFEILLPAFRHWSR